MAARRSSRRAVSALTLCACGFDASGLSSGSGNAEGVGDGSTSQSSEATGQVTSAPGSSAGTTEVTATTAVDTSSSSTTLEDTTEPVEGSSSSTSESSSTTSPFTTELCDGIDNDGDGGIDEGSSDNPACMDCTFWLSQDGLSYFAICTDRVTWEVARARCSDFGVEADLAEIETEDDQNALLGLVPFEDHWIGLDDQANEGAWFWVDGTQSRDGANVYGYNGWASGQPDSGTFENCGELDPARNGWADSECATPQPIVCRHPV
ncbi:MAG: C-type lectin domain-containing protein [Deltaproteobacteria bacterium]|nr:C-type lectin domain-containing protein [Nannocystaceae bacterium]